MAGLRNGFGKRSRDHDDEISKRSKDRDSFVINIKDTVFRYLCPIQKIGSIIGKGGDIIKQLRSDTKSKIMIGNTISNCEERVVTLYSSSDETNAYGANESFISPAQDALFRVHDKIVAEELHNIEDSEGYQLTTRLLVPSDQIGCIIGKGGQVIESIRQESGAEIRILKHNRLPLCAVNSDELIQITGDVSMIKQALYQIALRIHDNPSRTQHLLASAVPISYSSGGSLGNQPIGAPIVGIAPLVTPYGSYKSHDNGEWTRSLYSGPKDDSPTEFSIRLVSPAANVPAIIGRGGEIISEIRQDSGASIKVDSSNADRDDCLIIVSSREFFEDHYSPTLEAVMRLQARCSDKIERDSGIIAYTTRLLVPNTRIGCLLGKGGTIVNEMRKLTKANIRILGKGSLPKIASDDDEMVQISGDLDIAKDALMQICRRLRANAFNREDALSFVPVLHYLPVSTDTSDGIRYDGRESKRHMRGSSYSGDYASGEYVPGESYGGYGSASAGGNSGGSHNVYGTYSSGRSAGLGLPAQTPVSRRKTYY